MFRVSPQAILTPDFSEKLLHARATSAGAEIIILPTYGQSSARRR